MSVLNKPYELSVWEDVLVNGVFTEQKLCIIGAHDMVSQSRALQPKLTPNINGTNTFSFTIYYRYKDTVTGETVDNPFAQYLTNERKLKLHYDKWYDLIIKSVKIDSTKYTYDITATDQYINELSKNGFNLTFDPQLKNNLGTIQYLAGETLKETDWVVAPVGVVDTQHGNRCSEYVIDKSKEALVNLVVQSSFTATLLKDDNTNGAVTQTTTKTFAPGDEILAFYSCCKSEDPYFSFIDASVTLEKDDEHVISTKNCQYLHIMQSPTDFYTTNSSYGISVPNFATISITPPFINDEYRGARYVYSPLQKFDPTLNTYVTTYTRDDDTGYGFTETSYVAPNFIQNCVTNASSFKSTAGWNTAIATGSSGIRGDLTVEAIRSDDNTHTTLMSDIKTGAIGDGHTYIPLLKYTNSSSGLIVNSGFYDNRLSINNLENGVQYMFKYRTSNNNAIRIRVGQYPYDTSNHAYTITDATTLLDTNNITGTTSNNYMYKVATVNHATLTPAQYKQQTPNKMVLVISGASEGFEIYDFQCYKAIKNDAGAWIEPETQPTNAVILNTNYIYDKFEIDNATIVQTRDDFNPIWQGTEDPSTANWATTYSVEKRRGLVIKESNYYNIIQTLCENFECWAEFFIDHDVSGAILGKYLYFHNYTGDFNYAGFRYGVNLKSVQRTDDSKQIVSKLIVKQNSNQFGTNGFCTIARAPSNETGETFIYNIDYYINQGLLSAADWNTIVYDPSGAEGYDLDPPTSNTNSNGYYVRLYNINKQLEKVNVSLSNKAVALAQAEADLQLYKNGYSSAVDGFQAAANSFKALFGVEFENAHSIPEAKLTYEKNVGYVVKCAEYYTAEQEYSRKITEAQTYYNTLKATYDTLEEQAETLRNWKLALNQAFYALFYRYIQEGTWQNEDYYDDEDYYIDATSTLYNSAMPKVSYSISVLELSQLTGYEGFEFQLGDRTYIEDTDFFGYDNNGNPIREPIVLTEITYNLDQPEKNNIKVQNYKSQFQDLFKKITATVQSVSYSTGAYDKAAQLANADNTEKSKFLQGALNDSGTILENLADQTVRLDAEGLTIIDGLEQNQILRAVSGGIVISNDGGNTWTLGISSEGINANVINTGVLNTGEVNVMYSDEPTFRWDAYGITAYDFNLQSPLDPIFSRGVRFDRWGVYGFDLGQEESYGWHPNAISGWTIVNNKLQPAADDQNNTYIRNHSIFELTKEGLYLDLGKGKTSYEYAPNSGGTVTAITPIVHQSLSMLGKVEDLVYNSWGNNGPYLNNQSSDPTFVKLLSVGTNVGGARNENLAIFDDGTLIAKTIRLSGSLVYSDGTGLIKSVYSRDYTTAPAAGTSWNSLPTSSATGWHKTLDTTNDIYYSTTYDNGASWIGPNRLSTKAIIATTSYWAVDGSATKTAAQLTWTSDRSIINDAAHQGEYLYSGWQYTYTDTTQSLIEIVSIERIAVDGAAYSLSLSQDNIVVGVGSTAPTPQQTVPVGQDITIISYLGAVAITANLSNTQGSGYRVGYSATNINGTANNNVYRVTDLTALSGQVIFTLYNNNTALATKTLSVMGNQSGAPGEAWEIKFTTPDSLVQDNTGGFPGTLITAEAYKRIGSTESAQNVYWSLVPSNDTANPITLGSASTTITLKIQNNKWYYYLGTGSYVDTQCTPAAIPYELRAYTDSARTMLFDNETIDIIPHGQQGNPGQNGTNGKNAEVRTIYWRCYRANIADTPIVPSKASSWVTNTSQTTTSPDWTQAIYSDTDVTQYYYAVYQAVQSHEVLNGTEVVGSFSCTEPEIIYAYYGTNTDKKAAATFVALTNWGTIDGINYDNGHLYINATMINSGILRVGTTNNELFYADVDHNEVHIGGFTVTSNSIYKDKSSLNAQTNGIYIGTDGIALGYDNSYGHTFKVTSGGVLTAISGTIGGATINSARFYGGSGSSYTGMCFATGSGVANATYAFYAGATGTTGANAKFLVLKDGTLYATAAHITGEITATSGSFAGTLNAATGSFSGAITATSGTIGNLTIGAPSAGGNVGLYSINGSMANTCGQGVPSSSFYLGTNGLSFDLGSTDSDNYHGYTTVIRPALIMVYGNNNTESTPRNRLIYIHDAGISFYKHTSQFRDLSLLSSATKVGEIQIDYLNNRMKLSGTWVNNSDSAITSDRNLKHDIEDLDNRYDQLFDLLKPNRFKLNDGTSNRYHTGFIAQDVELAMQQAKLNSSELGALCISTTDYALRYSEFIALNTDQIQKLKTRIASLEMRIAQLESQLSNT